MQFQLLGVCFLLMIQLLINQKSSPSNETLLKEQLTLFDSSTVTMCSFLGLKDNFICSNHDNSSQRHHHFL